MTNHKCSIDFMVCQLADGRSVRLLTVLDDLNRIFLRLSPIILGEITVGDRSSNCVPLHEHSSRPLRIVKIDM